MEAPDRTLREKLYGRFLADAQVETSPELHVFLAARPAASVRELIGTVHRLSAAAAAVDAPVSLAIARQELNASVVATSAAPPAAVRQAADVFFLDDEKIVWEWPDVAGRLVEELR